LSKANRTYLGSAPKDSKTAVSIVICCVECGMGREFPYDVLASREWFVKALWENGEWLLSVVSKYGSGKFVVAPLCAPCAEKVHLPAVLKKARECARKESES